jgi:hypothetical protein
MNWLNLNIQTLDSENFLGSEPVDRATWLCLLRYCIGQENGGIIVDCSDWGDRKWQQLVRVTKKEAMRQCDLWAWEGNDLIVWGYPVEKEDEVQQKRERAKTNGAKGGRPKKTNVETQTETYEKPTLVNSAKAEGERKEKGKEGELEVSITQSGRAHEIPTVEQAKAYAASAPIPISEVCAVAFHDTQQAAGWITKHGHSIADWRAALRRYASLWNENEKAKPGTKPEHRQTKAATEYPEPKITLPRL